MTAVTVATIKNTEKLMIWILRTIQAATRYFAIGKTVSLSLQTCAASIFLPFPP